MVAILDRVKTAAIGKTYELSMTKSYVSRWGLAEAVRELIQNALDSASPFVYEWTEEEQGWTLMLNSELTVLPPQTLLLGVTSKGDSEDSIGSFGEGYKIALLVLTRLGIDVVMRNGDVLWKPRFKYSRTFDDEVLAIEETPSIDRSNKGLTFYIRGLTTEDKQAIVDSCLKMQSDVGQIKQTKYGDILLDRKGKLYVGSLYICDTEMRYGYNILPKYVRLERDRKTVDGWELQRLTLKMWYETGDTETVARLIAEGAPEAEYGGYDAPELVKEQCYKIFRELNPDALLADSREEAKEAIKKGLVHTVYIGGDAFYGAVSSSSSYKADEKAYRTSKPKPPEPCTILTEFYNMHHEKGMSRVCRESFEQIIVQSKNWRLK